ncbi:MAG TPA: Xaa-Pro aminopeptidase [Blastocatellia bacterium]|nr:Xaa-Pro aminopeptidase [Blastocatellia bacterium]
MKKRIVVLVSTIFFFSLNASPMTFGIQEPFAEGVITTGEPEYSPTFTLDGKTVYFTHESRERGFPAIYSSHFSDGKWSKPEVVPFSGKYVDEYPSLSPDGSKLYFASKRPTAGGSQKKFNDIWVVERASKGWGEPIRLENPINTDLIDSHPSVTRDGTIYFHSNRDGNMDVYRSRLVNGKYAEPEKLPFNSGAIDGEPLVSPDESSVIFSSAREGGLGSGDLYITCLRGGTWTPARNLGPEINTPDWDGNPFISGDGKYLYVSLGNDKAWTDIKQIRLKKPLSCEAK